MLSFAAFLLSIWRFPYSWRPSPFLLLGKSARCCRKRHIWASTWVLSSNSCCFGVCCPTPHFTYQFNGDGGSCLVGLLGGLSVMSHASSWHIAGAQNCCCPISQNHFSWHLLQAPLNHTWPCFPSTLTDTIVNSLWHLRFLYFIKIVWWHLGGSVSRVSDSWFLLGSWSHGAWVRTLHRALHWQCGVCLGFSFSLSLCPSCALFPSQNKI